MPVQTARREWPLAAARKRGMRAIIVLRRPLPAGQGYQAAPASTGLRSLFGGDPLAGWLLLPQVRSRRRTIPFCHPLVGCIALSRLQNKYVSHRWDGHAVEPHASLDLVLG